MQTDKLWLSLLRSWVKVDSPVEEIKDLYVGLRKDIIISKEVSFKQNKVFFFYFKEESYS
jgi:hypothetical protein